MTNQPNPNPAQPGPHSDLRLSDVERADALAQLSFAYGEGRLDVDEYDRRCDEVAKAATHRELTPLFHDLPATQAMLPIQNPGELEPVYSRQDIEKARANGKNTRLGIFGLGSVASIGASIALTSMTGSAAWIALPFLIIPTLVILLYIMKVGPDSWYAPTPRQIERQKIRELRTAQRIEAEYRRAQRIEQRDQLTGDAMSIAQRTLDRFNK